MEQIKEAIKFITPPLFVEVKNLYDTRHTLTHFYPFKSIMEEM